MSDCLVLLLWITIVVTLFWQFLDRVERGDS